MPHALHQRADRYGALWWPEAWDRGCVESNIASCPELTIHITNRGTGAHSDDALLLLPVTSAVATPVSGERSSWQQ